ncbi:hypothetical protein GIB67_034416 [Kingdonia uniflora]|uniref:Aminotransferase-like plant mobile domain-containing protein n=1 Tax=Kingdonia uniflora TaxID=39325 RepID=A0A7J7PBP4_9MAGN|nr:hypothetical protein GIB67_034416 [Kingdonia uniflora]
MPPKGRGKLSTMRVRKIVPTASLRKRLNEERDGSSHPSYNNPPRVLAKRRKTRSTRVPLKDSSISGSLPRVSVIPEEESSSTSDSQGESAEDFKGEDAGTPENQSSTDCFPYAEDKDLPSTEVQQEENFHNPTVEQQRTATTEEEVLPKRNSEQEAGENGPRDPYLLPSFATHHAKALILGQLIGLRVDGDLTVMKGAWGALAAKEIWKKCMYLPDSVYPDLKAGGQGISLSLKKIVEFFIGKAGKNVHDSTFASSIGLSSRMVGKAYMLYVLGSFLFPTKKGTDVSVKYLSFFQDQNISKPWSWGAATLAHLYYSLGASSRVNAKRLACCTTFLKVIFDPYVEKRKDKHMFKEVASFTGLLFSFTKLCPDVVNLGEDADYDGARVLRANSGIPRGRMMRCHRTKMKTSECAFLMEATGRMQADIEEKNLANSIYLTLECESTKKILEDRRLECESNKKLVEDLRMQLTAKLNIVPHPEENVGEAEMWKQKYEELHAKFEEAQRRLSEIDRNGVWRLALKGAIEGGDFEDPEDLTYEELDGNTVFRVVASYAYQSQIKFSNVQVSLCTLMAKKPSYWKSVFSQRLDVAYNDLGERRYETLLQAFKFNTMFVEYLYMGHLLATYCEKVVTFISNKEALVSLPLFWPKANNKITKDKRFENILVDSTKYWWAGMTSDENFVKLKTKYQSPIPSLSTLWWAHVKLDIPDAFVKQCVKNYFDAPNEAWMKLMKDNNVNSFDYGLNDLIIC